MALFTIKRSYQMSHRRFWFSLLAIVSLISLSACATSTPLSNPTSTIRPVESTAVSDERSTEIPTATPTATAAPTAEPIVIGVLVDGGNLMSYGEEMWRGLQLGIDYATQGSLSVADRPIQLMREDVASADMAISAVNRLVSKDAVLLVGPMGSNSTIAVSSMIEGIVRGGLVYFATSGAPKVTAENWSPNLFRVCAIYPADGPIVPTTVQEKVTTQFFGNLDVPKLSSDVIGQVGILPYHYTFSNNAANDWFVKQYRAKYSTPPDVDTECGFATGQAIIAGFTATKGDPTPTQLIPALEGLSFNGPRGDYQIRAEDHQGLAPVYIVRLINTNDSEKKFFELLQEIPGAESNLPCVATTCP